jgi:hypothetical protein
MTNEKLNLFKNIGYILLAIGILVEIIIIYHNIFIWMKTAWFTYPPDRFGIYVPFLFLSIFIYRLYRNSNVRVSGKKGGLIIILGGVLLFLLGYFSDIHILKAASLIVTGYGIVLYMMGYEWGRIMLFPFSFLFLMLPTTSFLIESSLSVLLRSLIATVSCKTLNSTGTMCDTINCILYLDKTELPVQYIRDSISSLMMHLILFCIAAEFTFIKNRSKFIYLFLFCVPYFIISHSVIYLLIGWSYTAENDTISEFIWGYKEWFPAVIDILMLVVSLILVKKIFRRKSNDIR